MGTLKAVREWLRLLELARNQPIPEPPDLKKFKRSNENIPELSDYSGDLGMEYWQKWEKYSFEDMKEDKSWVDGEALYKECIRAGYRDLPEARRVADYIKEGADIGCMGEGRLPTKSKNDRSAEEYGVRVGDMIQSWIHDKICLGPFTEEELPWKDFSVSQLKVKIKPNGKAGLILDLSALHQDEVELGQGVPLSVNAGIDKKQYTMKMSSTSQWVKSMAEAGVGARMTKADLNSAYKHFKVRPQDYKFQVFTWGGRFLVEIRLVFGAVSSPCLFNDPARMIIDIALLDSGLDRRLVQQQLRLWKEKWETGRFYKNVQRIVLQGRSVSGRR